jgi:hypothetical protein
LPATSGLIAVKSPSVPALSDAQRLTVFPGILGYLAGRAQLAALALATYDARAAPDRPSIGRQRGFGK